MVKDTAIHASTGAPDRLARWDLRPRLGRLQFLVTPRHRLALGGILLLAAVADFYQLARVGYGNLYYAATIKSMLQSWHNFFFAAFDPGGFVTVDKPPLGFWIQAASARLFGFSGFSILLPEAVAGVLSVAVLYRLVARVFGPVPGLLAALILAIMPISVVTNRDNTIDSPLVLAVLLAAWAACKAAESGNPRWLLACAALVGLGFNIKMLQAYLVVPAFAALYLFCAPRRLRVRVGHLALAGSLMLVISLAWVVAVDATPTSQRPYVGSSQTNSELELALGYNGLQRLTGRLFGGFGGDRAGAGAQQAAPPSSAVGQPSGGMFAGEVGAPGPLRLLNQQLGPQVSWLLPLALVGLLSCGWGIRPRALLARLRGTPAAPAAEAPTDGQPAGERPRGDGRQRQAFVLWGMWLLTQAVFFSAAGFMHAYYLVMLAPAVAALSGIGIVLLWRDYRRVDWRGWLLPFALALTATIQALLLAGFPDYGRWLTPLILVTSFAAAALFIRYRLAVAQAERGVPNPGAAEPDGRMADAPVTQGSWAILPLSRTAFAATSQADPAAWITGALGRAVVGVSLAALLLAPATWVAVSLARADGGMLPHAGPTAARGGFGPRLGSPPMGDLFGNGQPRQAQSDGAEGVGNDAFRVDERLIAYLRANKGSARYLFATTSANSAAPYILATGEPVMAMGGFSGGDPILAESDVARLVASGQVRFFLLQGGRGMGFSQLPPSLLEELPPRFREIVEEGGASFPGGPGAGGTVTKWVTSHCSAVPSSAWGGGTSSGQGFGGAEQVYACSGASAAG